jgi:hypothetical protein
MPPRAALVKPLDPRVDMPLIAAWIDLLRSDPKKLDPELVNAAIKRGLKTGGFWAIEGTYYIGTPPAKEWNRHTDRLAAEHRAPPGVTDASTPASAGVVRIEGGSEPVRGSASVGSMSEAPMDDYERDYLSGLADLDPEG